MLAYKNKEAQISDGGKINMAKIIAIANQKGGVAKTTTTAALADGLARRHYKVLVIDMDPQGNLSDSLGCDEQQPTVYDMLKGDLSPSKVIQRLNGFDIIPANIMLAGAEQELLAQIGKEQRLKEQISMIVAQYDYIIIDTPPALGILTINAFTAADEIIIPTQAGIFAATGITQLYETIKSVQKYCNPKVQIVGVLMTRYNQRTNNNKEMKELTDKIAEYMDVPMFKTTIRSSVVVEEAQARKVNLHAYKGNSKVADDYDKVVQEYLLKERRR